MNIQHSSYENSINKSLNPAFCGFLIAQFIKIHSQKNSNTINTPYLFLILPFAIHPKFRLAINTSNKKNFISLVNDYSNDFEIFEKTLYYFLPYTYEGLYFLLKSGVITIHEEKIIFNNRKIKPNKFNVNLKNEINACKKLANLLSNKFDTITIYNCLGVSL